MRSRPDLVVYLDPAEPCPGERLQAHIHLTSHSETPYDKIDVFLVGRESRYKRTANTGKTSVRKFHRREIVRFAKSFPGGVLKPGKWTQTVYFDLPPHAPPTYRSALATVEYELSVRVDIPWWPDKHEKYGVTLRIPPKEPAAPEPRVFTTQVGDQRGKDPVIELSLEDQRLPLGDALAGAVAITGLGDRKLRRVELAISTIESALVQSTAGPAEVDRKTRSLFDGTPGEGESIPFHIAIPHDLAPTFNTPFIRVDHAIEIVAVVAFGRDLTLRVPVFVERRTRLSQGAVGQIPLVGKQRHLAVWRAGIEAMRAKGHPIADSDPDQAKLVLDVRGLRATVTEEHREGLGPCLVAEIEWPALGVEMRVVERRWTDFGTKLPALDEALQDRFTVRVREPAQVARLLGPDVRDALGVFDEAALDDDGAVVVQKGGVYQIAGLERFLSRVELLAARLAKSIADLPPPSELTSSFDAFARFAERHGAILRVGDLSLSGLHLAGVPIELDHRFEGTRPVESRFWAPRPERAEPDAAAAKLSKATDKPARIEASRLGITLPLVSNPEDVLALADAFAAAVAALSGEGRKGPYR